MNFRILYLHETSNVSGAEESLLNLIRHLDRNRFTPIAILPEKGLLYHKLNDAGVTVYLCAMPRIRNIIGVGKSIQELSRIANNSGANLIHSNSIRTHLYGAYIAKRLKLPLVWHERNLITRELYDPDRLFSFLPNRIICNSGAILKRFGATATGAGSKYRLVYNGVDINSFNSRVPGIKKREALGIKNHEIVIGIASRLGPDKGHEIFLEAAKSILQQVPALSAAVRFLIVGDPVFDEDRWRENFLKNMGRDSGIGNNIIFAGFSNEMPSMYAAIDIFALTSFAEPCGRVLFEAMACGKPVVATNSGGTPEIVCDGITGFLVPPKQPRELANKLLALIQNAPLRKAMGEAGEKRIAENFTIVQNVSQIQQVYEELLSQQVTPRLKGKASVRFLRYTLPNKYPAISEWRVRRFLRNV